VCIFCKISILCVCLFCIVVMLLIFLSGCFFFCKTLIRVVQLIAIIECLVRRLRKDLCLYDKYFSYMGVVSDLIPISHRFPTLLVTKHYRTFPGPQKHFSRTCHRPAVFKYTTRYSALSLLNVLHGVVVCHLEQGAYLYMAQLMPLPLTVSYFSKIQIGFTFLVLAHQKRAVVVVTTYLK